MVLLNTNWTASSQISGLQIAQKKEIAIALIEYPFLKAQVSNESQLKIYCQQALKSLELLIDAKEEQVNALQQANLLLSKQLNIKNEQLKIKKKSKGLIWLLVGITAGVTTSVFLVK